MSPLFGQTLAHVVADLIARTTPQIMEFGAGTGKLARDMLTELAAMGVSVHRYSIVELSGELRARQQQTLRGFPQVTWLDQFPTVYSGVVLGNEVLDAMPVDLVHFDGERWFDRGVASAAPTGGFVWSDRPTERRPPQAGSFPAGSTTELHGQAEAFVATLADRLEHGCAFFIDYGFPESEYYHPQRSGGTLMCHRAHRADTDPLVEVGAKDISAHVDFTAIALAAQDAGFEVVGYTSQARFLMNCGLLDLLVDADLRTTANAQKLLTEHEMGELFKVLALAKGCDFEPLGFVGGDRRHTL